MATKEGGAMKGFTMTLSNRFDGHLLKLNQGQKQVKDILVKLTVADGIRFEPLFNEYYLHLKSSRLEPLEDGDQKTPGLKQWLLKFDVLHHNWDLDSKTRIHILLPEYANGKVVLSSFILAFQF
jgi:hypothetical protein